MLKIYIDRYPLSLTELLQSMSSKCPDSKLVKIVILLPKEEFDSEAH